jgi:hypothetical protein
MPTSYEIHPAIGIARVGSSRLASADGYFLGPEPDGRPPTRYRDPAGNLKRQAARFRIFRCRRDDRLRLIEAVEVDLGTARSITWTVHLANRKGVARRQYRSGPGFRNWATGTDVADRALIIDPGPLSVRSPGERRTFDAGQFRDTTVPLGEMFMDRSGRLNVLGGYGASGSDPYRDRLDPDSGHRADNDDWFDDTSDGPVSATVELAGGETVECTAWVIVGPPDYAPGVMNLVTLYDVIFDLAVRRRLLSSPADPPSRPSFERHIRPILARAMGYRWVNRAANLGSSGDGASGHGPGGKGDFSALWPVLSDSSPRSEPLRRAIAERLRDPDGRGPTPAVNPLTLIPRLTDTQQQRSGMANVLPMTRVQYQIFQAWSRGEFEADSGGADPVVELLPDALDRMALDACVGGALYPGIEASGVILCDPARYIVGEPFRLAHVSVRPGEVTEYNAVPWQADFQICRWQERDGPWPLQLGWWPAQRPDDVYPGPNADAMVPWTRGLGEAFQDMIEKWDRLGLVVDKGTPGTPFFAEDERDGSVLGP